MNKKINRLLFALIISPLVACARSIDAPTNEQEEDFSTVQTRRPETTAQILFDDEQYAKTKAWGSYRTVSFYGLGDNLIHMPIVYDAAIDEQTFNFKPIYAPIAKDIAEADIAYINQESIIGGDERGFSGYPAFNTPSDMIPNLVDLGFDWVTGSNNHSLDMGTQGVYNTLAYWDEYKDEILFTGIFGSQEQRDTIPVYRKNGLTFSLLTYTYGTNGILPSQPYFVNYFDPALVTRDVTRAKEISDFVIVASHMGDEHSFSPNQMQLDYSQLYADLGVDVVLGTHSHTIQPVEWVGGKDGHKTLVNYSFGNTLASTLSSINLLGGSLSFDFVYDHGDYSVENVYFDPHVIHYEVPEGETIEARTDFNVYKLADYTDELAASHALNGYEDNIISREFLQDIVDDVIDDEFLRE